MEHFSISKSVVFFHLSLNFNFFLLKLLWQFVPSLMSPVGHAVQPRDIMVCHQCAASVSAGEVAFTAEVMLCPKAAP